MRNDLNFWFLQREIELMQADTTLLLDAFLLAQSELKYARQRQALAEKELRLFLEEVKI